MTLTRAKLASLGWINERKRWEPNHVTTQQCARCPGMILTTQENTLRHVKHESHCWNSICGLDIRGTSNMYPASRARKNVTLYSSTRRFPAPKNLTMVQDETVASDFTRQACIYKMSKHATVSLMRYFNPDGTGAPTNRRCQSRSRTGSAYENATHSVSPTLHGCSFISPFMGMCVLASARQNKQF